MLEIEKTIREYLPNVIHMSLATSVDNKPWVCEVHFSYDENLNLYFRSIPSTRHCQELTQNKFVAGNIVEQHQKGQKPRGVYFEGIATVVENVDENSEAFKTYDQRFETGRETLEDTKRKFYKIEVQKFYVFDARESSPSKKYELDWKN